MVKCLCGGSHLYTHPDVHLLLKVILDVIPPEVNAAIAAAVLTQLFQLYPQAQIS